MLHVYKTNKLEKHIKTGQSHPVHQNNEGAQLQSIEEVLQVNLYVADPHNVRSEIK